MTTTRADRVADHERVAHHLIETVRRRFSGERFDRIVGREPNELVALGVVDPRDPPYEPPPHPDLPDEPGVPVDNLPSSEMGVTVWVAETPDDGQLEFDVDVAFSMYLPEYPLWEEQRRWMTGGKADIEAGSDDERGVRVDADDQTLGDDDLAATPCSPNDAAAPTAAGSKKPVRLAPTFRRIDVTASFPITVSLEHDVAGDRGAIATQVEAAITASGTDRLAAPLSGRAKSGVSRECIDAGEEAYEQELSARRTSVFPPLPSPEFMATAMPDPRGGWRVNLTLTNTTASESRRARPAQSLYNARFTASLRNGEYENLGYRLADKDWRTDPEMYALGRFCVGEVDETRRRVSTNTWPTYRDRVFESRPELQPSFDDLISSPVATLRTIAARMWEFADKWRSLATSGTLTGTRLDGCLHDLEVFESEAARFERGITLLERDRRLMSAFVAANKAFRLLNTPNALNPDPTVERQPPSITSWRLFQIVFIVIGLAALAAREHHDADLVEELDVADVLWFPTGGGKSEAFLGLTAVAVFFDRLRGKALGTTSLIRFPLRMLSVQQLDRVLRLVTACEHIRSAESIPGSAFELGYFVGRSNTPNSLVRPNDDRWGDIAAMARWTDEERRRNVVITTCPYCRSNDVELVADQTRVRLDHTCQNCGLRIPVVISDDEVFRTLPAVVVATVDKLAAIAFQPHFSHFTHGPAYECPDHGYVTFAAGPRNKRRCIARDRCEQDPTKWAQVDRYDPAPALLVQDELHLLSEDLGTLAAHYETLFQHLCTLGSGRPSKVVAATATISDYENQVRHLYARTPRRFPSEGYVDADTFYASRLDLTRRIFVGALPSRLDTAQFGIEAAREWRAELDRLRALDHSDRLRELGLEHLTSPTAVSELLYTFELQLFYANRKNDAERTYEQMRRSGVNGPAYFDAELLTGDTPLAEISAAIRRVEGESLVTHPDPKDRLAAVAGTSLVSHGVDLARLNVMHVAGMPSTNAYYVQATARAGRSDLGVVFSAYSRSFARDRSAFHFFEPHHRYSNQLVEAVSLNRFAVNGPKKTATGMLCAVILNAISRDPQLNPPQGNDITNFLFAQDFQTWLAAQPVGMDSDLIDHVLGAYGVRSAVLDPHVVGYFDRQVRHLLTGELANLRAGTSLTIQRCFGNKPPTSFRDIDEAVEFGAYGYYSGKDFETLTGRRDVDDGSETQVAHEQEDV